MTVGVVVLAMILAPRYARAADVAIVILLSNILGPLWTYLGLGEVPSPWTFYGGALLLSSLFLHEAWHLWPDVKAFLFSRAATKGSGGEAEPAEGGDAAAPESPDVGEVSTRRAAAVLELGLSSRI